MDRMAGLVGVHALYPAKERGSDVLAGEGVSVTTLADNLVVVLDSDAGAGTDPSLTLAIQHRAGEGDPWVDVPAAVLYDPATGQPATFAAVTEAASLQVLALKREQLRAQVRAALHLAGTTPTFVCGVYLLGLPKYAAGW
jgi:L-fucose mutarotase/ribose pyranase (RbsD/FucU family)